MPHVQRRRSGSAEHASGRRAPGSQWDPGPNIRSGPIRVPFAIEMSQYQLQNVTHIWGKCHGTYAGASKGIERTGDSHGGCPPRRTPREGWRRGQQKRGERATEACAVWCCGVGPARASRADCPCKGSRERDFYLPTTSSLEQRVTSLHVRLRFFGSDLKERKEKAGAPKLGLGRGQTTKTKKRNNPRRKNVHRKQQNRQPCCREGWDFL